jgi:hypothetical protein
MIDSFRIAGIGILVRFSYRKASSAEKHHDKKLILSGFDKNHTCTSQVKWKTTYLVRIKKYKAYPAYFTQLQNIFYV